VFTILRGGSLSWNTASLFFHGQNQLHQCLTCPAYLLIRKFSAARNSSSDASLLIPRRLYGYITWILGKITEIKSSSQNRCSRIIITTVTKQQNQKVKHRYMWSKWGQKQVILIMQNYWHQTYTNVKCSALGSDNTQCLCNINYSGKQVTNLMFFIGNHTSCLLKFNMKEVTHHLMYIN